VLHPVTKLSKTDSSVITKIIPVEFELKIKKFRTKSYKKRNFRLNIIDRYALYVLTLYCGIKNPHTCPPSLGVNRSGTGSQRAAGLHKLETGHEICDSLQNDFQF